MLSAAELERIRKTTENPALPETTGPIYGSVDTELRIVADICSPIAPTLRSFRDPAWPCDWLGFGSSKRTLTGHNRDWPSHAVARTTVMHPHLRIGLKC
jgi:hypothetical protein